MMNFLKPLPGIAVVRNDANPQALGRLLQRVRRRHKPENVATCTPLI
jgi:hypothetical protein